MKKEKITIIIPCYNVQEYLPKCLESVLNSTFKDIEIIAINDGSTDNTIDILNEYAKKDKRIKVYDQKNVGQAKTRNRGIDMANGEYLFFLDSDDYIDQELLEKLYNETLLGYEIVISGAKKIVDNNIIEIDTFIKYTDDNKINYILNSSGPAWKLIKKSIITENKLYFYEDHIYEDIAIVPVWGMYAQKISYVPDTYYYYLIHSGSTMNQVTYNQKLEDIFYSLDYLSSYFKDEYNHELEYIYIKHLLHAASLRFLEFKKYDMIDKISNIMHKKFPNWKKNIYYKKDELKYKVVCNLLYYKQYFLLKLLLRK